MAGLNGDWYEALKGEFANLIIRNCLRQSIRNTGRG